MPTTPVPDRGVSPSIGRFYADAPRYEFQSSMARRRTELRARGASAKLLEGLRAVFPSGAIPSALEVGGEYATALAIVRESFRVGTSVSCDLVRPAVQVPGIRYEVGSAEALSDSFAAGSFDLVLLIDVIEHLYDPDRVVEEIRRVLKPGGALAIITPNLSSWLNRLMLLFGFLPLDLEVSTRTIFGRPSPPGMPPAGHIRVFTRRALLEFLRYHRYALLFDATAPLGYSEPTYLPPESTSSGSETRPEVASGPPGKREKLGGAFRVVVRIDGWISRALPKLGSRLIVVVRPEPEPRE